jgi:hypothetical protein
MSPTAFHEIWIVLLFCLLTWGGFAAALYLPDSFRRKKEAWVGGALMVLLSSILGMLSGFAAAFLQAGLIMSILFQASGIFLCTVAVSRVLQMLTWPRTWLVGLLALLFYLLSFLLVGLIH